MGFQRVMGGRFYSALSTLFVGFCLRKSNQINFDWRHGMHILTGDARICRDYYKKQQRKPECCQISDHVSHHPSISLFDTKNLGNIHRFGKTKGSGGRVIGARQKMCFWCLLLPRHYSRAAHSSALREGGKFMRTSAAVKRGSHQSTETVG